MSGTERTGPSSAGSAGTDYFDAHQNIITCPSDFTATHADDVMFVPGGQIQEWIAESNGFLQVDLWGGGGGGTGSSVSTMDSGDINVTVHAVPRTFDMFFRRIPLPSGVYYKNLDDLGNVQYVAADDSIHLVHHATCSFLHLGPCWEFQLNGEILDLRNEGNFRSDMRLVALDGTVEQVPQGRQQWIHPRTSGSYPLTQSQLLLDITIEPAIQTVGICGGSGGSGSHVTALVELKAGRRYRLETGLGGNGSGADGAAGGQSSRVLEGADARQGFGRHLRIL